VPLNLVSCVQQLLEANSEIISDSCVFHTDFCDQSLIVSGDASQLQVVFTNLLENACEAVVGVDHPMIIIRGEAFKVNDSFKTKHTNVEAELLAHLEITDNGLGIDLENLERIF